MSCGIIRLSRAKLQVRLIDERLSSVTAREQLHQAGVSSKDFKESVDQLAARVILQQALDYQQNNRALAGSPVNPASSHSPQEAKDGPAKGTGSSSEI